MDTQEDIANYISPYPDEHYSDFYDVHVAKFWKPGHDSDVQLVWESLQDLLRSPNHAFPLNVVDMGTGTGRVIRGLLETARASHISKLAVTFFGIDPEPEMLRRGKDMLSAAPELSSIASVEWITSDASGFTSDAPALRGATDLLCFAGGGFQHLLSPAEVLTFLREVERALRIASPTALALIAILGESIPSQMNRMPNYDAAACKVVSARWPEITYDKSAVTTSRAGNIYVEAFTLGVRSTEDGRLLKEFKFRYDLAMFDEKGWLGLVKRAGLRVVREREFAAGKGIYLQRSA